MREVDEVLELLVRAEAAVNLVVIRDGVAVVRTAGHVVLLRGVEPDGGHAQVGDVVQVLFDALQVAAVAGILLGAVHLGLQHPLDHVVRRVTVGEAVGHDEVEHVLGRETLYVLAAACALLQGVRHGGGLLALLQDDVKGLRCGLGEVYVQ